MVLLKKLMSDDILKGKPYIVQRGIKYAQSRIAEGTDVERYTRVLRELAAYEPKS